MACECDHHRGLHVSTPTHLIELLRPDGTLAGPGESGEIVVTCFETFAMPLIRYRIGDLATWAEGPCDCGRAWPLLRQVNGRVMDAFETPGSRHHRRLLLHHGLLRPRLGRRSSRSSRRQRGPAARLHRASRPGHSREERIERDLAHYDEHARIVLGPACRVEYEFVDAITPTPQGKHRYTISKPLHAGCRAPPSNGVASPDGLVPAACGAGTDSPGSRTTGRRVWLHRDQIGLAEGRAT